MSILSNTIRIILTVILLIAVYYETGWATTLCLLLTVARFEVLDYNEGRTWK